VNKSHPAITHLPDRWTFVRLGILLDKHQSLIDQLFQEEEVYFYRSDPRAFNVDLLLTVDENSYARGFRYVLARIPLADGNDTPALDTGQPTGNYNQGTPHPIGNAPVFRTG
jgi:hypothetical protein